MTNEISLEKSVKNILVKRLVAAYALITVLLIIIVLIFQLDDIRDLANEQAVESVNRFNAQEMGNLDNSSTMNAGVLHRELYLKRAIKKRKASLCRPSFFNYGFRILI